MAGDAETVLRFFENEQYERSIGWNCIGDGRALAALATKGKKLNQYGSSDWSLRALGCFLVVLGTVVPEAVAIGNGNKSVDRPTVTRAELVRARYVGKTMLEIEMRAYLTNSEPRLTNTLGTIRSSSGAVQILDRHVDFGTVEIDQTVVGRDTFSLRWDVRFPIKGTLSWDVTGSPDYSTQGDLIAGDGAAIARLAVADRVELAILSAADVVEVPGVGGVARGFLDVRIGPSATVRDVNSALRGVGGTIETMIAGSPWISVQLSGADSIQALQAISRRLIQSGAFSEVVLASAGVAALNALPPGPPPPSTAAPITSNLQFIDEQLAMRAGPAWNLRHAAVPLQGLQVNGPTLTLFDCFFDGPPCNAHGQLVYIKIYSGFEIAGTGNLNYLTAINPLPPAFSLVDPLAPGPIRIPEDIDSGYRRIWSQNFASILQQSLPVGGVVNSSWGYCDVPPIETHRRLSAIWIESVRGRGARYGVEYPFVHVTGAGNTDSRCRQFGTAAADGGSPFNLAALSSEPIQIQNSRGDTEFYEPLQNTLVVESRVLLPGSPGQAPLACERSPTSFSRGNVAAVGYGVYGPLRDGVTGLPIDGGTSVATGNVTSLVYFLMRLDPAAPPTDIVEAVIAAAARWQNIPPSCNAGTNGEQSPVTPTIDAYSTLLDVDVGKPDRPIRQRLLDVTNANNRVPPDFDIIDFRIFVREFNLRVGRTLDYSRLDLNGDGRTGGTGTIAFDLNADGAFTPGVAFARQGITFAFDERAVTDLQVLCYYALSAAFYTPSSDSYSEELDACRGQVPPSTRYRTYELDGQIDQSGTAVPGQPGERFRIRLTVDTRAPLVPIAGSPNRSFPDAIVAASIDSRSLAYDWPISFWSESDSLVRGSATVTQTSTIGNYGIRFGAQDSRDVGGLVLSCEFSNAPNPDYELSRDISAVNPKLYDARGCGLRRAGNVGNGWSGRVDSVTEIQPSLGAPPGLFEQRPFSLTDLGGVTSMFLTNGSPLVSYESFQLNQDADIELISWHGYYVLATGPNGPIPGETTAWRIEVRADEGGRPAGLDLARPTALLEHVLSRDQVLETDLGVASYAGPPPRGTERVNLYMYSARLPFSFRARAGQRYWLSIAPVMEFPPYFGWQASRFGGTAFSWSFSNGQLGTWPIDPSFGLSGQPVMPASD